ncbi:uncharacterized protein [Diadema antillarum]|uniref:uncharacterized protein n=1 Tax=Diadema antillarum TaxID=105358 RepID=UPI003A851BC2
MAFQNFGRNVFIFSLILMEYLTFVPANGLTMIDMQNKTVPICDEFTCQQSSCGNATPESISCRCDFACTYFEDCCPDHADSCGLSRTSSGQNTTGAEQLFQETIKPLDRELVSCSKLLQEQDEFWMVAKCPKDWKEEQSRSRCEEPYPSHINLTMAVIPVVYEGILTYRNIYCALCNGRVLDELVFWKLAFLCPSTYMSTLESGNFTVKDLVTSNQCNSTLEPPDGNVNQTSARQCFATNYIDRCPPGTSKELGDICSSFTQIVSDEAGVRYKNAYCQVCNSMRNATLNDSFAALEDMCRSLTPPSDGKGTADRGTSTGGRPGRPRPDVIDRLQPLSITMDFSRDNSIQLVHREDIIKQVEISCPPGKVYDPTLEDCLTVSCADGYQLRENTCHRSVPPLNLSCGINNSDLNLRLSVEVSSDEGDIPMCLAADIINVTHFVESILELPRQILKPNTENVIVMARNTQSHPINVSNCVTLPEHNSILLVYSINANNLAYSELDNLIDRALLLENSDPKLTGLTILGVNITQQCMVSSGLNACPDELTVLSNVSTETINGTMFAHDRENDELFHPYETVLTVRYYQQSSFAHFDFRKEIQFEVCKAQILTCPTVTRPADYFIPLANMTGFLNNTVSGEILSPHDYRVTSEGNVQFCTKLERNATLNQTETFIFFSYSRGQVILTYVALSISILSLLITFASYCIFQNMRRCVSNKLIMTLCLVLLLAQLLQMLSPLGSTVPVLCVSLSVVAHFMWTSVFALTTCLAFELNRTLGSRDTVILPTDSSKALAYYILFTLATSSGLVATCVALYLTVGDQLSFWYGRDGTCWISDKMANFIAFGCPLASFILVNILLFCHTVTGIRSTTKVRKSMIGEKETLKEQSKELRVYVKISTLLGFTWLFGFIAGFAGVNALWYIFIILNALQGFYIFLAFIANRRVGAMWMELLCHCNTSGLTRMSRGTSSVPLRTSRFTSVTSLPRNDEQSPSGSRRYSGDRVPGSRRYMGVSQKVTGDRRHSAERGTKNGEQRFSSGDRTSVSYERRYSNGDRKQSGDRKYISASERRQSGGAKSSSVSQYV